MRNNVAKTKRRVTSLSILLLVISLCMVTLLRFRPIDDVDIFWQVKAGELMLQNREFLTKDPFTFTHAEDPTPVVGWLAQIIFAGIFQLGGWQAVRIVHVFLYATAFLVAAITAIPTLRSRRISASLFSNALALSLGFLVALSNSSVRPQSFGMLCFALLLLMARSNRSLLFKVLLITPVLVFWQNCHPSAAIGVLACGALFIGEVIQMKRMDKRAATHCLVLGMLVALAQFATPMGWRIFELSAANMRIANYLGISEWQYPWHGSVRSAVMPYWIAVVITSAMLVRLKCRANPSDLALCAIMTMVSLSAARFALFWALAMIPIWTVWSEEVRPRNLFAFSANVAMSKRAFLAVLIIGMLLSFLLPAFTCSRIMDDTRLPTLGVVRLQGLLAGGRIYNYREWGGPLILQGHPDWRVLIDGRLYLFAEGEWADYNAAARGEVPIPVLQNRYQPDAFFLQPTFHHALVKLLQHDEQWHQVYADRTCVIFLSNALIDNSTSRSDLSCYRGQCD